jgi:hypothetical protein
MAGVILAAALPRRQGGVFAFSRNDAELSVDLHFQIENLLMRNRREYRRLSVIGCSSHTAGADSAYPTRQTGTMNYRNAAMSALP